VDAVDLTRGVIMIIMALDHTRDFFGMPGAQPTNLATTTAALFATRWITNICAPVFFLLIGTGARLSLRKQSVSELARFLVTRGLWLVVAEVVVARCLAYQFNVDYRATMLLVLWAAGWCMMALAALIRLPMAAVLTIGLGMIAGHNVLDGVRVNAWWWAVLHGPGMVIARPDFTVFAAYPLIPWIGVTAVGYALGTVYDWERARRQAFLVRAGVAASAAFVLLRFVNGYGDPAPWSLQGTPLFTALSFLNTSKYPPSLLFLLMTLGPALLLLAALERDSIRALRPALAIGRVPFFYYVGHFALIHVLAVAVCLARYGSAHWMFESPDLGNYPFTAPPGWGNPLPVVYGVWALVVVLMYPLCRWFAGVKQRNSAWWLSYL
jgi:uncharacterized membrane protein